MVQKSSFIPIAPVQTMSLRRKGVYDRGTQSALRHACQTPGKVQILVNSQNLMVGVCFTVPFGCFFQEMLFFDLNWQPVTEEALLNASGVCLFEFSSRIGNGTTTWNTTVVFRNNKLSTLVWRQVSGRVRFQQYYRIFATNILFSRCASSGHWSFTEQVGRETFQSMPHRWHGAPFEFIRDELFMLFPEICPRTLLEAALVAQQVTNESRRTRFGTSFRHTGILNDRLSLMRDGVQDRKTLKVCELGRSIFTRARNVFDIYRFRNVEPYPRRQKRRT